jgi:hypothetical protein
MSELEIISGKRQCVDNTMNNQRWIPVSERLPVDDRKVLICTNFGDVYTCRLPVILKKNERMSTKGLKYENVTHWMRLPTPPEQE